MGGQPSTCGIDTQAYYGVNGIGLVKIVSAVSEGESQSGAGSRNFNDVITSDLTGYSFQPRQCDRANGHRGPCRPLRQHDDPAPAVEA